MEPVAIPASLQTIAQIGIAFAGFSGLVIAFRRKAGPLSEVHKYRLRVLLTLAFGAMFLALLPELLQHLDVPAQRLWRVANLVAALYSCAFLAWWYAASRQMMRLVPEIFSRFALFRMTLGHVVVIALLLIVAAGYLATYGSGVYLAALAWYLLHSAQQFSRMLFVQPLKEGP